MVCYLIDDDHDDQEFFAMALEQISRNIRLMTCSSAVEALDSLRGNKMAPNIIFLDINMPRIDGWQCLEELKKIEHLKNTPVVIYSTSESGLARKGSQEFAAFLTKQPRITELAKRLEDLFTQIKV